MIVSPEGEDKDVDGRIKSGHDGMKDSNVSFGGELVRLTPHPKRVPRFDLPARGR